MPKGQDSTTKFKADITDFKSAMQEAARYIKLVNSEFKSGAGATKSWSSSVDGVSGKLKQLNGVLEGQERQLSVLESEYNRVAQEQGATSKGAQELLIRVNNQKGAIAKTQSEIAKYNTELEKMKSSSEENATASDKLKSKINDQESELAKLKQKYTDFVVEQKESTDEAKELADEISKLSTELKQNKTDIANAEKAADNLDESLDEVGDSAEKSSGGFTVMKGALANLVADGIRTAISGLKELAKQTYEAGANFEQGMAQVQAVSGASGKELENLTAKAKEMGSKTKFSATESAEAFNYMAMAGWKTEDMIGGIEGIMNLAAASGSDLATTSDIVTDALTAMGYSAKDAGQLADVMASASSNANTNVEMMGATFQYAAPIVGALGYNMEDTAVAIGMMANAGIKGEKAGTALRSILTRLSAPPKECAKQMDAMGISLTDAQGKMKPMNEVITDLRKKFSGLSESEQTAAAKAIAGQEAMSGLLAIVNGSDKDFDKLTKAVENSTGAAQDMADTMNDTVSGQVTLLKSQIEGIMIDIFEKVAPQLKAGIAQISKALEEVNWDNVSKAVTQFATKVVSLFSYLVKHGDVTIAVLKGIAVAFAGIFVTNKIATFTTSIMTLSGGITKLSTSVKGLEVAQKGAAIASKLLSVGLTALPFVAVAAGAVALGVAMYKYNQKQEEAVRKDYELTESQKKIVEQASQTKKTYDEMVKSRSDAVQSATSEINSLDALKTEYNNLIGSNGKVKKGYEDRANYILGQLASALGLEQSEIQKLIDKNGKLGDSIDKVIEKKKLEATLSAYDESYKTALQNRTKTQQDYASAMSVVEQAQKTADEAQEVYNKKMAEYEALCKTGSTAAGTFWVANQNVATANDEAQKSLEKAKKGLTDAQTAYEGYSSTITNYETASKAVTKGGKNVELALLKLNNDFKTSESATKETLQQQVTSFKKTYEDMKKAAETESSGVAQKQVSEWKKLVDASEKELAKATPKSKKKGEESGKAHADGVKSTKTANKKAGKTAGQASVDGEKSGDKNSKKTGKKAGDDHAKGVESTKEKNKKAGESAGKASVEGEKTGGKNSKKTGSEQGQNYAEGVSSKKGKAKEAGESLGKNANDGANSYKDNAEQSGSYFGEGFFNGIGKWINKVFNRGESLGKNAHEGLKKGQQEGSPSKLTYKSGVFFTQGYINGISSQQKNLVKVVQGMVKTVVSELGKMNGYNFSEVGSNASTKFADAMNSQISYMTAKMQYQNEKKVSEFDTQITKLEKTRDKKISALEKKQKALEDKKSKAKKKTDKASYEKQINAVKKQISATKSQYTKLINTQNKYKTAYQSASSQMLSEFSSAMSDYQSKAQALIDDTINGITDEYNTRYNELISKQDTLIEKMKSAGELFEVSGAGVMTVNDLKEQTKAINDYANKLTKIKSKVSSELFDQITSYDMTQGSAFIDRLLEMSASDLNAYNKAYTEKMEAAQKAGENLYKSDFDKIASDYKKEINSAFKGIDTQLKKLGNQAMKGFVNGLTKNTDYMDKNVKTFVKSMIATFKKELKIKSPSRVMFGIGEYTGEGFNNGLVSLVKQVKTTASNMASAVSTPLSNIKSDIGSMGARVGNSQGGVYNSNQSIVNNYNLVQNNTSPKSLSALETYQARRRQIAMMKAATS